MFSELVKAGYQGRSSFRNSDYLISLKISTDYLISALKKAQAKHKEGHMQQLLITEEEAKFFMFCCILPTGRALLCFGSQVGTLTCLFDNQEGILVSILALKVHF